MTARPATEAKGEIFVDGRPVSWVRDGSVRRRALVLLGHGAGAPYSSDFMRDVAAGLVQRGVTVVRFHFAYMERAVREGRRRPPDPPGRLVATCRKMFETVVDWLPAASRSRPPVVVGGKSLGGRMMSMLLADEEPPAAAGAVYLGYPLHAPGRTDKLRDAHLPRVGVPQLFVSGSRDSLAQLDKLQRVVSKLGDAARLEIVDGGDHSLVVSRRDKSAGRDAWLDTVADFIERSTAQRLQVDPARRR